jgi:alginate O-acetyltransferase complex protein AlgF
MNRNRSLKLLAGTFAVAALCGALPANAQLYAKQAPPGSAFVHVFNATASSGVSVQIGDAAQPRLLPYSATSYIFLPPGEHNVQVGARHQSFALEGDHYYTVCASAEGLQLLEFHQPLTGLKAMLAFFNLMPGVTLTLKTADGATSVFEAVAPNTSVQRTVNPLTLSLALFRGSDKFADVPPLVLERGKSFSLFVVGSASAPVVVWNKD